MSSPHDPTPPEGYRPLREGERLQEGDLITVRPGTDLSWFMPGRLYEAKMPPIFRPLRPNPADDAEANPAT